MGRGWGREGRVARCQASLAYQNQYLSDLREQPTRAGHAGFCLIGFLSLKNNHCLSNDSSFFF